MRIMKDFTKKFQNLAVSGKNSGGFSAHKLRMEGGYGGGTKDHSKKGNGFPSPFLDADCHAHRRGAKAIISS